MLPWTLCDCHECIAVACEGQQSSSLLHIQCVPCWLRSRSPILGGNSLHTYTAVADGSSSASPTRCCRPPSTRTRCQCLSGLCRRASRRAINRRPQGHSGNWCGMKCLCHQHHFADSIDRSNAHCPQHVMAYCEHPRCYAGLRHGAFDGSHNALRTSDASRWHPGRSTRCWASWRAHGGHHPRRGPPASTIESDWLTAAQ